MTATLTVAGGTSIDGVILDTTEYTVAPAQAAFAVGFVAPAAATIIVLDPLAVGSATATTGTSKITYALTSGTFDATAGILIANWTLGGINKVDLGNILSVILSNSNKTATITFSGTIGANTQEYTVTPVQAAFAAGFTAPAATEIMR